MRKVVIFDFLHISDGVVSVLASFFTLVIFSITALSGTRVSFSFFLFLLLLHHISITSFSLNLNEEIATAINGQRLR